MILDKHKDFKGLCIEFKSPTSNYYVSEAQKQMKKKYLDNGYAFILSNDYDRICKNVHEHTAILRKVVGKNVHATIPKGNMGYEQYTAPDTVAVEYSYFEKGCRKK